MALRILPLPYRRDRMEDIGEAWQVVKKAQVNLRGWPFPWLTEGARDDQGDEKGNNYVGAWLGWTREAGKYKESWHFYLSGQLAHYATLMEDAVGKYRRKIETIGLLYTITEYYEFAARLAEQGIIDQVALIEVALRNADGYRLFTQHGMLSPYQSFYEHTTSNPQIEFERKVGRQTLLSSPREPALKDAVRIMQQFGFKEPPIRILAEEQRKLLERRILA